MATNAVGDPNLPRRGAWARPLAIADAASFYSSLIAMITALAFVVALAARRVGRFRQESGWWRSVCVMAAFLT